MDSTELNRQLLGVVSPWTVERVEMSVHDVRVDVYLSHTPGARFACPECGGERREASLRAYIATIQKRACGYRNAVHFKIAVYFHCGGLDLWLQS